LIQKIRNNKNIEDIQRRHIANAITLKFIRLYYTIRYDTIEEITVDSKAQYTA